MKTPLYFQAEEQTVFFSLDQIEYLGDFPGLELLDGGWKVSIRNQKKWEKPTRFVLYGSKSPAILQIKVAKNIHAHLDLYHLLHAKQGPITISLQLSEGSRLEMNHLLMGKKSDDFTITRTIFQTAKSSLDLATGMVTSGNVTLQDHFVLTGEESNLNAHLLAIGGQANRFQGSETIFHKSPRTTSNVTNLLVSAGTSKMNIDVTGTIEKGNYQSACHQTNRGIILEETGVISVEPKLVIDEFDVDAGHGCAIGQINAEELYYLNSRGLDEATAKKLIISGYLAPLYMRIGNPGFLKAFSKKVDEQMKGANL